MRLFALVAIWIITTAPFTEAIAQVHRLSTGWNLVGNNSGADVSTAALFGVPDKPSTAGADVISVWAWDAASSRWSFFSPTLSTVELSTYTASNGYSVLNRIPQGSGFWINAKSSASFNLTNTSLAGGYPLSFNGINILSVETVADRTYCNATVTFRNVDSKSLTPYLYFDVMVNGISTNQSIFHTNSLAPGSTASDTSSVMSSSKFAQCGTFTLQFNAAASRAFTP